MPSTPNLDISSNYSGNAPAATDRVNATQLDSDHVAVEAWANEELLPSIAQVIREDDTLVDGIVRSRNLHPEVSLLIASKAGWQPKVDVQAASLANIVLTTPGATIDGRAMVSGDRFLAKNQTVYSENGIYVWNGAAVAATRATDCDSASELGYAFVSVAMDGGTTQVGTSWVCNQSTSDIASIGVTSITFSQVGANLIGNAMRPVNAAATLAAARAEMGPWGDILEEHEKYSNRRGPRMLYSALFGVRPLKYLAFGDSLGASKTIHFLALLDRKFRGSSNAGVNYNGNVAGAGPTTAGYDLLTGVLTNALIESNMFQYSFTGDVLKINSGGSATFVYGGVAPSFTTVRAYIVKEPGAGTVTLKVGGTNRGVMNAANASVTIGTIDYTQDFGVSDVEISVSGGSVHVLFVHAVTGKQGVDYYSSFNKGGLKLSWPMENAQGCGLLSLVLSELEIDFLSFEMDDEFGTTDQTILQTFFSILDANCRYADKLIFASTPRSANDSGKLESRKFILDECYSRDVSYIPFDCYRIMGSYSDMVAIFGSDDGTHPNAAAQLYSAEMLWTRLGLDGPISGMAPRAINDTGTPSRLATGTAFHGPGDTSCDLTLETDQSFGIDWKIRFPRSVTLEGRGDYGSDFGWRMSANASVVSNLTPMKMSFDSDSSGKTRDLDTNTGYSFTNWKDSSISNGYMNMRFGLIKAHFTRAQLLGMAANSLVGSLAFCTDCTGGASWVYARGTYPQDWVTIDGNLAI